ncbi:MAG: type II secretion system F family protein [Phycisphaerales bacterium]|jgi:type IV pilus assembly protein PilC|nr:type II secretion system F family protein [Phycisphaerales bacterium]
MSAANALLAKETFAWKARDIHGRELTGSQVASNEDEVANVLRTQGLFITAIDPEPLMQGDVEDVKDDIMTAIAQRRIKQDDVIAFCQQLAVMLETGVPLSESLEALMKQTKQKEFREVLEGIHSDVCGGDALSSALARRKRVFPRIVVSLVRASELSGTLPMMLERVASYLSRERKTIREVKGAMTYPMIMGFTAVVVTSLIVTFVLPRFAKIYEMRAASLPMPTKILMGISDGLLGSWMYWIPTLAAIIIAAVLWHKTTSGRNFFDWMKLRTPIVGPMFGQLYTTRASRTLSTLLAAGVGILDAIGICRDVTDNVQFDQLWTEMENDVRNGHPISDAVFESPYVPSYVASMMASGERSGKLPSVMDRVASFTDEELESRVKKVSSMIEPLMILVMGGVVGGVAIAMLLPIFSMSKVISGV